MFTDVEATRSGAAGPAKGGGGCGEAGDENVAVDGDLQAAERGRADDVLQGLTLAAPFDQVSQGVEFHGREGALEVEIQLHSRQLKQVSQEQFRLQARGIHALFGQELGAALDDFQDGHGPVKLVNWVK